MGATTNIILVMRAADFGEAPAALAGVSAFVSRYLGRLAEVCTYSSERILAEHTHIADWWPGPRRLPAPGEFVSLYPEDVSRGSALMSVTGAFFCISFAVGERVDHVAAISECWAGAGAHLVAALVGEELEVQEEQIRDTLEVCRIPTSLDLCSAAIIKYNAQGRCRISGVELPHGGWLLQS